MRRLKASTTQRAARLRSMLDVPLRWPRITTRRLMVLVAVAALALGAEMTRRRGEAFAEKAAEHAKAERAHRALADSQDYAAARSRRESEQEAAERAKVSPNDERHPEGADGALMQRAAMLAEEAKYTREHAAFHEKLINKYQHAARYPWLPVEPDPPKPSRKR